MPENSERKHTPEPWSETPNIIDQVGTYPCYTPMSLEDYKRSAHCVNACAGMDDPEARIRELLDPSDLERFKVKIGEEEFDLTLPGNGRFDVRTQDSLLMLVFRNAEGTPFIVWANRGEFHSHWFPDACDNAAEWHEEQANKEPFDGGLHTTEWRLRKTSAAEWRAAKRGMDCPKYDCKRRPVQMNLKDALAKWPEDINKPQPGELLAPECDALVAEHVMGWYDYRTRAKDQWNPTTDWNDCVEAVTALARKAGIKLGEDKHVGAYPKEKKRYTGSWKVWWEAHNDLIFKTGGCGSLAHYLLHPSDICRTMLEALLKDYE